jgi:hypothetical protein
MQNQDCLSHYNVHDAMNPSNASQSSRLDARERVRVGNDSSTGNVWWRDGSASQSSLGLVGRERIRSIEVLVDHSAHALLAMVVLGLRAVEPGRVLVLDFDLEDIGALAGRGIEVEAGEETVIKRLARLGEAGLDNGMVLWEIVELDNLANFSYNVLRVEDELASATSDHSVGDLGSGVGSGWTRDSGARRGSECARDQSSSSCRGVESSGSERNHFELFE